MILFSLSKSRSLRSHPLLIGVTAMSLFDIFFEFLGHFNGLIEMTVGKPLVLIVCQLSGGVDYVSNLPPVQRMLSEDIKLVLQLVVIDIFCSDFQGFQKVIPDLKSPSVIERRIMHCQLHPGHEGLVEHTHAVGSQDQYTFIVFQNAKKY